MLGGRERWTFGWIGLKGEGDVKCVCLFCLVLTLAFARACIYTTYQHQNTGMEDGSVALVDLRRPGMPLAERVRFGGWGWEEIVLAGVGWLRFGTGLQISLYLS